MQEEKLKYGSVAKTFKLDDDGSTIKATMTLKDGGVEPLVKIQYTIRHRLTDEAQESPIYEGFKRRRMDAKVFDPHITYEMKKLTDNSYYYMIENYTYYKRHDENAHVKAFVEQEKRDLGLA